MGFISESFCFKRKKEKNQINNKIQLISGNRAVKMIKNENSNVEDCRLLYSDFKDLNDWLINENPSNKRTVKLRRR